MQHDLNSLHFRCLRRSFVCVFTFEARVPALLMKTRFKITLLLSTETHETQISVFLILYLRVRVWFKAKGQISQSTDFFSWFSKGFNYVSGVDPQITSQRGH